MATITLALHAMATRFEIVLHGRDPVALRAAGEEALEEIERLEAQLSLFRPTSEIAHLNARAAREPVRVTPALFGLLEQASRLSAESEGAFDITIAPLVRCWGFLGASGHLPRPEAVAEARAKVGMNLVQLDPHNFTVRFAREGIMLDLGAIGKGYAVERAVEILREAGVTSALLHGGTSTIYGLGRPPDGEAWKIAIDPPQRKLAARPLSGQDRSAERENPGSARNAPPAEKTGFASTLPPLATVYLKDQALSVSGAWGKSFEAEGQVFGHVLDPRTGEPARGAVLAAVLLPSATETDALSTALLVAHKAGHERLTELRPNIQTLLVWETQEGFEFVSHGIPTHPSGARRDYHSRQNAV